MFALTVRTYRAKETLAEPNRLMELCKYCLEIVVPILYISVEKLDLYGLRRADRRD